MRFILMAIAQLTEIHKFRASDHFFIVFLSAVARELGNAVVLGHSSFSSR
ncbi:hypothetical protein HW132_27015 [Brasilonema sp. CT11]|nr:hypothetical protein [Brasilonema sp. CT11]